MQKIRVGIVGATGYVGQRFLTLLEGHPYFDVVRLAASARSAGSPYAEAVAGRWRLETPLPLYAAQLPVEDVADWAAHGTDLDLVFCAVNLPKETLRKLEEDLARQELVVVSNNSAHRWTPDVPLLIPEVNPDHLSLLTAQKQRLGTSRGCIVCKPNCSLQAYVAALTVLKDFEPDRISVCTYQAVSGAGRTLDSWPEIGANVIPYIGGEEEKSEQEPLKLWGTPAEGRILPDDTVRLSAQCYRVPVQEGHLAAVSVSFRKPVDRETILRRWQEAKAPAAVAALPSAPKQWMHCHTDCDRPQPRPDAPADGGMAIHVGRLREDALFDFKFTALAHNTIRGAAGGAILTAELMHSLGLVKG